MAARLQSWISVHSNLYQRTNPGIRTHTADGPILFVCSLLVALLPSFSHLSRFVREEGRTHLGSKSWSAAIRVRGFHLATNARVGHPLSWWHQENQVVDAVIRDGTADSSVVAARLVGMTKGV